MNRNGILGLSRVSEVNLAFSGARLLRHTACALAFHSLSTRAGGVFWRLGVLNRGFLAVAVQRGLFATRTRGLFSADANSSGAGHFQSVFVLGLFVEGKIRKR